MRNWNKKIILLPILVMIAGFWVYHAQVSPKVSGVHTVFEKALYYCPMHPTYTSDKPGNCLICQMKLVKREVQQTQLESQPAKKLNDICYLHTCPIVHKGEPCPMLVVAKEGEQVTCPICGTHVFEAANAAQKKKILYWTDPMMPGYKSDKSGKSPMGMDLIPVYEEEVPGSTATTTLPKGYAPILVTPQKQQLIGIKTVAAKKMAITKAIRTVGRIAYDPELYQAEQEYLQSLKSLKSTQSGSDPETIEQAKRLADSSRMKLRLKGLDDKYIDEMENWPGPDKSLLLSDQEGKVWLYAPVYEYELPFVKTGQAIVAEVPATGRKLEGVIRSIDSVLDPMTRSVKVRAVLTDSEKLLKPEMYVNVNLQIDLGEVLVVPEEAVFSTGEKNVVFIKEQNGVFEPREVSLGVKSEKYQEIRSGISEGENVVVSGNFLIDSESRLKAALTGMSGGGHQHGA